MQRQRGFALLTVLWLTAILTGLTAVALHGARIAGVAAANRMALERARWMAEACLAAMVSVLDSQTLEQRALFPPAAIALRFSTGGSCVGSAVEAEASLNQDSAPGSSLQILDSLVTAAHGLPLDSFLTRDGSGRVDVNAAPEIVLAALPGLGPHLARSIADARLTERRRWGSMRDLLAAVPPPERDSIQENITEIGRWLTFTPTGLELYSIAVDARAPPTALIVGYAVPVGTRVVISRRRLI